MQQEADGESALLLHIHQLKEGHRKKQSNDVGYKSTSKHQIELVVI